MWRGVVRGDERAWGLLVEVVEGVWGGCGGDSSLLPPLENWGLSLKHLFLPRVQKFGGAASWPSLWGTTTTTTTTTSVKKAHNTTNSTTLGTQGSEGDASTTTTATTTTTTPDQSTSPLGSGFKTLRHAAEPLDADGDGYIGEEEWEEAEAEVERVAEQMSNAAYGERYWVGPLPLSASDRRICSSFARTGHALVFFCSVLAGLAGARLCLTCRHPLPNQPRPPA